jgi:hypothetical protein
LIKGSAAGFDVIRMTDHAYAHGPVLKRDQPAPPVVEPARSNVALIHTGKPGDAFEMAEHGGATVFLASLLPAQLTGQKGVTAAGIHDESRFPIPGAALTILAMDQGGSSWPKLDPERPGALVEVDALGDRILGENLIEFRPLDLKGVGLGFIERIREMEHVRPAMPMTDQLGAVLDNADFLNFRQDPQSSQYGNRLREQRFADMEPRMRILFEDVHIPPLLGQNSRNAGTGGSTSDH